MIFAFALDTSASMNRPFSRNLSYLEASKHAIEHFIKFQSKAAKQSGEPTFILATYDSRNPIKSVDTPKNLLSVLQDTAATDMSDAGACFSALFEYLNALRVCNNGGDVPGKGRYPALQESTLIFWITDSSSFSTANGVDDQIQIPLGRTSQHSGFMEPFRWEQRLYTIVLGDQGQNPLIGALADSMGGKTWRISNLAQLTQCIDNCFETRYPNIPPFQPLCHIEGVTILVRIGSKEGRYPLFLYANRTVSASFPIPESFWPVPTPKRSDFNLFNNRTAHPHIYISTKDEVCSIFDGFPCERLSMEQVDFTQELIKRPRNTGWLAYVENSQQKPGLGQPFGFFKATKNGQSVNFYILPYNFKKLFALLTSGLIYKTPSQVTAKFTSNFANYLRETPPYYWPNIRKALDNVRLSYLWPQKTPMPEILNQIDHTRVNYVTFCRTFLDRTRLAAIRDQAKPTSNNADVGIVENVFDVSKDDLERQFLLTLGKMQTSSKRKATDQESKTRLSSLSQEEQDRLHCVPIEVMGNYRERMEKSQSQMLRDPFDDEESIKRREDILFGNPYMKKKKQPASKLQAVQEYPNPGSPDSIMNEADEEASHGFEKELKSPDRVARKSSFARRKRVPLLYKKPLLSVPSFNGLRWNQLEKYNYSFVIGLGDLAVDSVVKELEQAPTPSTTTTDPSPDIESLPIALYDMDRMDVDVLAPSLPDLDGNSSMISSDTDDMMDNPFNQPSDMTVSIASTDDDDVRLRNDWGYARKAIHTAISRWPKLFKIEECVSLINIAIDPSNPEYSHKRQWVLDLARKFNQKKLLDHLEKEAL